MPGVHQGTVGKLIRTYTCCCWFACIQDAMDLLIMQNQLQLFGLHWVYKSWLVYNDRILCLKKIVLWEDISKYTSIQKKACIYIHIYIQMKINDKTQVDHRLIAYSDRIVCWLYGSSNLSIHAPPYIVNISKLLSMNGAFVVVSDISPDNYSPYCCTGHWLPNAIHEASVAYGNSTQMYDQRVYNQCSGFTMLKHK